MSQYPWLLLAVYVVAVGGVQLLALWAATSRRPWLLRALAVWLPIALLATVRAYEPALVLLVSVALTIGICWAVQRFGQPRDPAIQSRQQFWRFRLADLLVLMLFLGTWLGITTPRVPPAGQLQLLLPVVLAATPLVLLTLFVDRAVTGPQRVRAMLLALSVIWVCALLMRLFNVRLYLGEGQPSLGPNWPRETAYYIGAVGGLFTGLVLCLAMPFGVWTATRNWPSKQRHRAIFIAIVVALACGVPLGYLAWEFLRLEKWQILWQWSLEIAIHSVAFFALAAFVALGTWLAHAGCSEAAGWRRLAARAVAISFAALVVLPAVWIYWQMLWYTPYPLLEHGPVNHYDRIVAIAKRVGAFRYSHAPLPKPVHVELDEAVILLRDANYVPDHIALSQFQRNESVNWLNGQEHQALCWRLQEAAEKAVENDDPDRAADYAVAIIRFDAMLDRGGTWGTGYPGYRFLAEHRDGISPAKAREIIELLQKSLVERYDAQTIAAQNRALWERQGGWRGKLRSALARLQRTTTFDVEAEIARIHDSRKPFEMTNRLLQAELAIHIYDKEHGGYPASLEDLTPDILSEVPLDPYSGKPFIYRQWIDTRIIFPPRRRDRFIVYSVGPDGMDDGGNFVGAPASPGEVGYDLRLNYPQLR